MENQVSRPIHMRNSLVTDSILAEEDSLENMIRSLEDGIAAVRRGMSSIITIRGQSSRY
jgi:hypothetical protein